MSAQLLLVDPTRASTSPRVAVVDVVALMVVGAVALSPLLAMFDGPRVGWAVGAGLAGGLLVGGLGRLAGLGPWLTALSLVAVYLAVGPGVAVPDDAASGWLPGRDALAALVDGAVTSWKAFLTDVPPFGDASGLLVVPFVLALVGACATSTVLWRSNHPQATALVVLAMFVAAAAAGSSVVSVTESVGRGLLLAVGLLLWTRWRAMRGVRGGWGRRLVVTSAVVGLAAAVAGGAAAVIVPDREVLRDAVVPPFHPERYPSPLSAFRSFLGEDERDRARTLVEVEGEDLAGLRLVVATMDRFDGSVWNVTDERFDREATGTFSRLPLTSTRSADDELTITVTPDYQEVFAATGALWLPGVGSDLTSVSAPASACSVLGNRATGTLVEVKDDRCRADDGEVPLAYTVADAPMDVPTGSAITGLSAGDALVPDSVGPPEVLLQAWGELSGNAEAGGALMVEMESRLREEGTYSDGIHSLRDAQRAVVSPGGHSVGRLETFAQQAPLVGNAEQYASAMALLAREYGLPSRVVIGFEVPADGRVTGDDVTAWTEVSLGDGWVAFDPTPEKDSDPPPTPDDESKDKQPSVLQPPEVPRDPADADQPPQQGAGTTDGPGWWQVLLAVLGVVVEAVKVAGWLSPLWGIVLFKVLRRRRRRRAESSVDRISGGWREITDRSRDLGTRLSPGDTRYESSVALATRFPQSRAAELGAVADRHVFGPVDPTDDEVTSYWADVDTALRRMRQGAPWWRQPLAWLSPVSLPWSAIGVQVRRLGALGWSRVADAPRVRALRSAAARWYRSRKVVKG